MNSLGQLPPATIKIPFGARQERRESAESPLLDFLNPIPDESEEISLIAKIRRGKSVGGLKIA